MRLLALALLVLFAPVTPALAQPGAVVAYAWADQPTAASYTPSGTYAFNPLGTLAASRTSAGVYQMAFAGFDAFTSDEEGALGTVLVTPYGTAARTCTVASWSGVSASVRCFDASGAPADSRYAILRVVPGGEPGDLGFAWANDAVATTAYAPSARYAANTAGRRLIDGEWTETRVQRAGTGRYRVDWLEQFRWWGTAPGALGAGLVTPYGSAAAACAVRSFVPPNGSDMRLSADCETLAGAPADARFTALGLWPGSRLGLHAYTTNNEPSTSSTPNAAYSHNPGGGATTITREATGRYLVTFAGLGAISPGGAGGGGHAQVVGLGTDAARCQAESYGGSPDAGVRVRCYDAAGALADSRFTAVYVYGVAPPAPPVPTVVAFEAEAPGTLLVNQYAGQSLRLPLGLEVVDCTARTSDCARARSSDGAGLPPLSTEFDRYPIRLVFDQPQQEVSLSLSAFGQRGTPYEVLVQGFDASGAVLREDAATLGGGSDWGHRFTVRTNTPQMTRVEVFATRGGVVNNFLLVDDLAFSNSGAPAPDTTPPTLTVLPGNTSTTGPLDVTVTARDNRALGVVSMTAVHVPSGTVVWPAPGFPGDLCGGTSGTICPATTLFTARPIVTFADDGDYRVTVTASDVAGNEATTQRTYTYTAPPPTPLAYVYRVEWNQAARDRPGLAFPVVGGEPTLVRGKPLLLRYYLFGSSAPVPGYAPSVQVRRTFTDGTSRTDAVSGNVGPAGVDVAADPGPATRDAEIIRMRADPTRTLNAVVPGSWLADPALEFIEFRLYDAARAVNLSVVQTDRLVSSVLRLSVYRVVNATLNGPAGPPTSAEVNAAIQPFLEAALPVSRVQQLYSRTFYYPDATSPLGHVRCGRLLRSLWWNADDLSLGDIGVPSWHVHLAVARNVGDDCSGIAWRGDPSESDDRYGDSYATTELFGDIATHEVMHTMGFKHASNGHGEGDGGSWEAWPFPHGLLSGGTDGFGVVLQNVTPPTPSSAGTWNATLVDPCPGPLATRSPSCTLPDVAPAVYGPPHELMSYGDGPGRQGFPPAIPLTTGFDNWISWRNYLRVNQAINGGVPPFTGEAEREMTAGGATAARSGGTADVLLVSAEIAADGTAELFPMMHRAVPAERLAGQAQGAFQLDLYGAGGALLQSTSFASPERMDGEPGVRDVRAYVPFVAGIRRAVLTEGGAPVIDQTASPNAPTVQVLAPNGGEAFPTGQMTVSWTAADADGDLLTVMVQYSPDGGQTWEGLAVLTSDGPSQVPVTVDELTAGTDGVIRVVVSDGLHVASDLSDAPFALGTPVAGEPAPAAPTALALLGAAPNPVRTRADVRFDVPAEADVRVELYDLLGRRVAVLADGPFAAGTHGVLLDASALPAGVYVLRLDAGGTRLARPVTVVR